MDDDGNPLPGISFGAEGVPVKGYFDAEKQAIVVDDIVPQGGRIVLAGRILSTGNGRLVVANGYANVDIDNQSDYKLILNRIDTTREREGQITILDTYRLIKDDYKFKNGCSRAYPSDGIVLGDGNRSHRQRRGGVEHCVHAPVDHDQQQSYYAVRSASGASVRLG